MTATKIPEAKVVDYDSGYNYESFWDSRGYEEWAETHALQRLAPQLGHNHWLADFGGGFGRNAIHYPLLADRAILIDYSVVNLSAAATRLEEEIGAGHVHLVRADLSAMPLVDAAVDSAIVIRVLHHLVNLDSALAEMARVVGRRWLLDIPIKHHALGRLRSALRRQSAQMSTPEPLLTGSTEFPFHTYHLPTVRHRLDELGWNTRVVASVNNFRRWDQLLPKAVVRTLRPAVYSLEVAAQRLGRQWWGPSQFVVAWRRRAVTPRLGQPVTGVSPHLAELAQRLQCPRCRQSLTWTEAAATCTACARTYPKRNGFWDFVTAD